MDQHPLSHRRNDAFARAVRKQMTRLKQEFNEGQLGEADYHRALFGLRMNAFSHYSSKDHWRADDELRNARFHAEVVHKLAEDAACLQRYWAPAAEHFYFSLQREEAVQCYRELFIRSATLLQQDRQDADALKQQQQLCLRYGHALLLNEQPIEALSLYRQVCRCGRVLHLICQNETSAALLADSLALELSWSRKLAVEEGMEELLRQRDALCEQWELSRDLYPHIFERSLLEPFFDRKDEMHQQSDIPTQMMQSICYLNVAAYLAGWVPLSREVQSSVVLELMWFMHQMNQYDEQFDEESFQSFYQTVEKLLFLLITVPDQDLYYAYSILLRYCRNLQGRNLPTDTEQELLLDLQLRLEGGSATLKS